MCAKRLAIRVASLFAFLLNVWRSRCCGAAASEGRPCGPMVVIAHLALADRTFGKDLGRDSMELVMIKLLVSLRVLRNGASYPWDCLCSAIPCVGNEEEFIR